MTLISKHRAEKIKLKTKEKETCKTETQKHEKLNLPKEQVENADLYKPVLNKIMTRYE